MGHKREPLGLAFGNGASKFFTYPRGIAISPVNKGKTMKQRLLNFILITVGATLIAIGIITLVDGLVTERQSSHDVTTSRMLTLVNEERYIRGIPSVIELKHLDTGAYSRAIDLKNKNQWSHKGYVEAIDSTLWYPSERGDIGENLAKNFKNEETVMKAWMNSPMHKELILQSRFKYIGIGHYKNYWVLWFSDQP